MKILGYVRVEIEGYYLEKFINLCTKEKINIWNIRKEKEIKIDLNVGIKDFKKLIQISKKTKCKIKIKKKIGLPFIFHRYRKRKLFLIFLIFISIFIYTSTKYIWNIDINISENQQLENIENDLSDLGLKKGVLKNKINVNNIITKIKLNRNDISWIGIDIRGTNAIVKIVKAQEKPEIIDKSEFCNIVASKSGIITKIIAQNGTPIVKIGDKVEKGDVLIGGFIEGKYTEKRLVHSLGEVEAKITYTDTITESFTQDILIETGNKEKKFQIKFNNFQINFYKTLSKFKICDTIYAEQKIKLFSNFYLPISVVQITNIEQEKIQKKYSEEEAKTLAIQELERKFKNKIDEKNKILRKYSRNKYT